MISKDVVCNIKKRKFYRAIEEVTLDNSLPPVMVFYSFVIYLRYKSYLKCATTQKDKDIAYIAFQEARGTMWGGIILGMFPILILGSFLFESIFK